MFPNGLSLLTLANTIALNCEPGGRFSMLKSGSWSLSSLALFSWETEETTVDRICGYLDVIFSPFSHHCTALLSSHLEHKWLLHSPVISRLAGQRHAGEALDQVIVTTLSGGGGDVNFGLLYFVICWQLLRSIIIISCTPGGDITGLGLLSRSK